MPSETFHFEHNRLPQLLLLNGSHNLQSLEKQLQVKATAREAVRLVGWKKEIDWDEKAG